jgi:hypothetical protein
VSPLEQRYRRLLQWLPEPARSRWADDMTETYLSVTTADDPEYAEFGSPSTADRLDVARLALGLRLGAPGASVRAVAAGQTVRLVAAAGTVALASTSLVGLVSTAWLHDRLPFLAAPELGGRLLWGPREALLTVLEVLTVALAVCVLRGTAATRLLALAVLTGQLAWALTLPTTPVQLLPQLTGIVPLVAAALLPTGVPLRRPWWLLAVVVAPLLTWPFALVPDRPADWVTALADPLVQWAVLATAAGVLLLWRRGARGPAELAVAVLATATLPGLAGRWPYESPAGYHAAVLGTLLAATLTAVVTGRAGLRALTALPADTAADAEHP